MRTQKILMAMLLASGQYVSAAPVACLIEPDKVAEVGASSIGVIEKIILDRGDYVKEGQVVGYLKADVERASVGVASARAQADAEVKVSMAAHELAMAKLARTRELFEVGFVSKEALEQAAGEARVSKNRVLQSREGQTIAHYELELSNSQLAQRSIRSPFSGVVVDRYRTEGERVEREPIFRIAKMHPLRVEAMLPVSQFGQVKLGTSVSVQTDLPGLPELTAKVVLIDSVIDAASNTFRVRLTLPNPDYRIPAGLRCKADFGIVAEPSTKQSVQPQAQSAKRNAAYKMPETSDGLVLRSSESATPKAAPLASR